MSLIAIDSLDYKNILKLIFEKFSNEIISAEADNEIDNRVKVKLKEPSSKQSLYNLISSSGIDIDGMGIIQPTLNDIFVEYTEDKIWKPKERVPLKLFLALNIFL